jgi:uncharacterized protein YceH (UPF0502 family)
MQDTPVTDTASEPGFDLDAAEIRVLGVLIEKSFITPDAYPMSVNGIVTGCNQLTAREPVMSLSESEVQAAIDSLIGRRLVAKRDQPSARVAKYEHLVRLRHSLPPAEQAVLAMLMLRGAQTAGELRQRCERLHRFDDIAAVDAVLEHLAEKYRRWQPPCRAHLAPRKRATSICWVARPPSTRWPTACSPVAARASAAVALRNSRTRSAVCGKTSMPCGASSTPSASSSTDRRGACHHGPAQPCPRPC